MSWANDLQRIAEKGQKDLGELARATKIELFSGVVKETRVDTGRLRGNWQISENSPASGELERLDKTGAAVISEITGKASEDGVTYLVNNLPYAIVYEEKDAMIGRNVARVRQMVARLAKNL